MSIWFQSLRSSSSGNCLMLWTDHTTLLIDCGIKSQKQCRALLDGHAARLDAVLVSHAHGDHICYSALRVLEQYGTPVRCHDAVIPHVHRKHTKTYPVGSGISPFSLDPFWINELEIHPIPLPHEPCCPTFGFVIRGHGKTIVICTDFNDGSALHSPLIEADFIFIESNHDLDLLRKFPNYASHFHMSNNKTAGVLAQAVKQRLRPPQAVMLGHLSEQRNTADLATQAVHYGFTQAGIDLNFDLLVAPAHAPSELVVLN